MTEPAYATLRVEDRGFMTWVELARPTAANALSGQLLDELSDVLKALRNSGGRVIGIRGGGKGFSAGYDLGAALDGASEHSDDAFADRERLQGYVDHFLELWDHPKPIIAAVHGYCIGGATQLCSYADIVMVAEDASIGESTIPLGAGFVAPTWVPSVGVHRAKELAFAPAYRVDGRTAVQWGWANHAVPEGHLIPATEDLARRIARMPADALRIKKLAINRAAEAGGPRGVSVGLAEMDALAHTSSGIAALRAWVAAVGVRAAAEAYRSGVGLPFDNA